VLSPCPRWLQGVLCSQPGDAGYRPPIPAKVFTLPEVVWLTGSGLKGLLHTAPIRGIKYNKILFSMFVYKVLHVRVAQFI